MSGYVYILKSLKNNRFYIGSTDNLERRFQEHNLNKSTYTSESGPWEMIFKQEFESLKMARKVECWLKRLKNKNIVSRIVAEGIIQKFNK